MQGEEPGAALTADLPGPRGGGRAPLLAGPGSAARPGALASRAVPASDDGPGVGAGHLSAVGDSKSPVQRTTSRRALLLPLLPPARAPGGPEKVPSVPSLCPPGRLRRGLF